MSIRLFCVTLLLLCVLPAFALSKKKKKKALYSSSFLLNSQHTIYQKKPLASKGFELYFTKQRKKQKWLSLALGMNVDFSHRFYPYSFDPNYFNSKYPHSTTRYYYFEWKRSHVSFPVFVQFRLLNKPRFSLFLSACIRSTWLLSERNRWAYYYTNSPGSTFNPGPFTHDSKRVNYFDLESISPIITSEAAYGIGKRYSLLARITALKCRYLDQEFMWNIGLGIKRVF